MKRIVNGIEIDTKKEEFVSCNIIECEVGTNGFQGGDTGHGSRTFLSFKDCASTDINAKVYGADQYGHVNEIVIELGGDCELETFILALEYAAKTLRETSGLKEPTTKERQQYAFRNYLHDMVTLYKEQKSLKGMSELQKKHKVSAITKAQFFEFGLDEAAKENDVPWVYLSDEFCNNVYEYVLYRGKNGVKKPKFVPLEKK